MEPSHFSPWLAGPIIPGQSIIKTISRKMFWVVKNVNKNQCMHRKIELWYKCCTHSPAQSEPCVFDRSITLWTRRNPSGADPSWKMRNKLLSPPHIYSSITRTWENVEQVWRRRKLFFRQEHGVWEGLHRIMLNWKGDISDYSISGINLVLHIIL